MPFCFPGTNAATERVFSLMNDLWTSEKFRMKVETVKAILTVKVNRNQTFEEIKKGLAANPDLIQKIHSSEKYPQNAGDAGA